MARHNEMGTKGEQLAIAYLKKKGYSILHSNWRFRHKEVDIIAQDNEKVVVVEVKLRSTDYFGSPSEAVTRKKQRYLIEAADAYLDTIDTEPEVRFDIVSIIADQSGYRYEHIDDAFIP